MPQLEVMLEVPLKIAAGLASGQLERVGGVVREVGSNQVVMWLREGAQIANNSNLAGGVLRSLLDVGSGGLTGVAFGTIDAVVAANRHKEIMQALSVIQGLTVVGAAAPIVGIGVEIASTIYLVKRINDLHRSIINEFELDRRNKLESAIEYVQKIIPKLGSVDILS